MKAEKAIGTNDYKTNFHGLALFGNQYMFFPFLTSKEGSHFPNQHFYFIFEKLDKVSFSMQFIASQTFVKSVTLILT